MFFRVRIERSLENTNKQTNETLRSVIIRARVFNLMFRLCNRFPGANTARSFIVNFSC